jgi:hypothetical protein
MMTKANAILAVASNHFKRADLIGLRRIDGAYF